MKREGESAVNRGRVRRVFIAVVRDMSLVTHRRALHEYALAVRHGSARLTRHFMKRPSMAHPIAHDIGVEWSAWRWWDYWRHSGRG